MFRARHLHSHGWNQQHDIFPPYELTFDNSPSKMSQGDLRSGQGITHNARGYILKNLISEPILNWRG
jgi:hypothetical protein